MKYENFKKAKEVVELIDKLNDLTEDLKSDDVSIRIARGQSGFITIGCWNSCEHECSKLAIAFVGKLKDHYKWKLAELHLQLSKL